MTTFTPVSALIGGALIGLSAVLLMLLLGRIAGIAGIAGGLFTPPAGDRPWRLAFVAGLVVAPAVYAAGGALLGGHAFALPAISLTDSTPLLIAGGLLVGFGVRLGSGCTSGHGVCGIARLSRRSIAATVLFMAAAVVTVFVTRHLIGA